MNNICRKMDEVLQNEYRELGSRLKKQELNIIISGLFLVPHGNARQYRKGRWCRLFDHWNRFWDRGDLHKGTGYTSIGGAANSLVGGFARRTWRV